MHIEATFPSGSSYGIKYLGLIFIFNVYSLPPLTGGGLTQIYDM